MGQALAIGTNTADSVRPAALSSTSWGYSLFQSFGSGTFVPDFSGAGAFVIAASGGHNVTPNLDAIVFDFADATWKRIPNANGVAPRTNDFRIAETTGAPYYEVLGATAGQLPSPPHLYLIASYVPSLRGGGSKGSYIKIGSPAVCVESRQGGGIHKMDLATGLWTRVTNDTISTWGYSYDSAAVFDPVAGRYYFLADSYFVYNYLQYLDLADWRVKRTETYPYPAGGDTSYMTAWLDPVRRLILLQRPNHPWRALDLNNISAGWTDLRVNGSAPGGPNRWVLYEPDGRFYTRMNNSGQTLWRLTPPVGDWRSGTWQVDTVTINGAAMPNFTVTGDTNRHYGCFFYVPALRCLAWVSGERTPVVLVRPPA